MRGEDLPDAVRSGVPYVLPPGHPFEIDRLNLQHHALRAAMRGNYLAPVVRPRRVLDVGSGTGRWGYDLCEEFPDGLVIGLDMVSSGPRPPPNYRFVQANVLDGLPFTAGSFDFVHQRLMQASIPLEIWPAAVVEMVRVARPGGLVELLEIGDRLQPIGPATRRLFDLLNRLMALNGLDPDGRVLQSLTGYLRRAGATEVEEHALPVPIGAWGGPVGSLMATDVRTLFSGLQGSFERTFSLPPGECAHLLAAAMEECESCRSSAVCTIAYGRKPSEPADAGR